METIKIGGIDYVVKYEEIECADGIQFGSVRYDKTEIVINDVKVTKQKQDQTLMHELIHAMLHEVGLDELSNDEVVVNQIGIILYQVLKDNDFSWLRKQGH